MSEPAVARARVSRFRPIDRVLIGLMLLGIVVVVEPAPFDLAVVLAVPALLLLRQLRLPRESVVALGLVFAFILANFLSLAMMTERDNSNFAFLGVTIYLLVLWFFVVAVQGGRGPAAADSMLWGYAVSTAIAGGLGVLAYAGVPVLEGLMVQKNRLFGLFKDPNVFGAYLVPGAVYAVAVLIHRASRHRLAWIAALGLTAGGILLSFSRGSWVNVAVSIAMFFVLYAFAEGLVKVWWRTAILLPLLVVVLGYAAYEVVTLPTASEMLDIRFGLQSYDTVRFDTQAKAISAALQDPIGLGPGGTGLSFTVATHNSYVRAWLENGLLGALSLIALMLLTLARVLWLAVASRRSQDGLRFRVIAASLCGMFVEAAVIDTIHWRHFWLLLGLGWCPAGPTRREMISNARIR